jgi:CubicO group peptidase (beta-lactamase class C family)
LFSVQSVSKNFTAAAVLLAVLEGLLDLDRPISEYLPSFTVNSRFEEHPEKKMTLRLLLSHRAGFTHEAPVGNNYDGDSTSLWVPTMFPAPTRRSGIATLGGIGSGYLASLRDPSRSTSRTAAYL